MPLPETSEIWPPARFDAADELIAIWDAWYTGDTDALQVLYATTRMTTKTSLWGQVKRMFWGTPTPTTSSQVPTKLHVGVASVIARLSASTLVEDLPLIRYPKPETDDSADDTTDKATDGAEGKPKQKAPATVEEQSSKRITDILDDEAHAAILEALEFAAAHGGSYLRVTWDNSPNSPVKDKPFLTTVPADGAVPEFRWGRLVAVTFWSQLAPLAGQSGVWRLLERHEPGTIEWGLYWSQDTGTLGTRVPLADHTDTEHLAAAVDEKSQVATGSELLTAVYIPNAQPNRRLRKDPVARHLGRSDFDGAEELMDALDEAYTSWMRDIRLGKARIMVPKGMLTSMGAGNGATFNADQEIFTELGTQVGSLNPGTGGNSPQGASKSFIDTFQPLIRYKEHMETCAHLLERIYAQCGYSAQTFGDGGDMAITATESVSREKMSDLTRSAKIVAVRPRLAHISAALLDVDRFVFNGPGRPEGLPDVEFSDGAAINPKIMAETLSLLNNSESASIETRVKMLHEDWDKDQVDAEVTKIRDDLAMLPDPSMAHLWMAESANGSATGGVNAGRNGVDPSNADAVNAARDALTKQEDAANGGPAA